MATQKTVATLNGVDVSALKETLGAIKEQPDLAKFKFRVSNKWLDCGHSRTTVEDFYGTREEHSHKQSFTIDADEPELLLGGESSANPVEYLLASLAACVTTGIAYHAAARDIEIESIESSLEGNIDLRGFLGISDEVRPGLQDITVTVNVKSNASAEQLEELTKLSPILDTVTRAVPVNLKVKTS